MPIGSNEYVEDEDGNAITKKSGEEKVKESMEQLRRDSCFRRVRCPWRYSRYQGYQKKKESLGRFHFKAGVPFSAPFGAILRTFRCMRRMQVAAIAV